MYSRFFLFSRNCFLITNKTIKFPSSKILFKSRAQLSSCRKMSTNAIIESSFPNASLVPKAETGVTNFLQKYPEFNGKDVTIAIFDSGVDPKGSGLEVSSFLWLGTQKCLRFFVSLFLSISYLPKKFCHVIKFILLCRRFVMEL